MKEDLINLLIKDCCKGRHCKECPFLDTQFNCRLREIINILEKNERENENYEK